MTSSSTSPEGAPSEPGDIFAKPYHIEGMPEILQIEKLDELAGVHEAMLASPSFQTDTGPDEEAIKRIIADTKERLLRDAGFVVDTAGRTDEQERAYEFASKVLDGAIDCSAKDWLGVDVVGGFRDGPRNQIFRELLKRYHVSHDVGVVDDLPGPERKTGRERLGELQEAKCLAFVARMKGPAYGKNKRAQLDQAYVDAELAYMVALTQQNKQNITAKREELVGAGKTDPEIAQELKAFIKTQAEAILQSDRQRQHDLFVEKSGALGKLMEKYANLSWKGKLGVGALMAVGTFAGGAAIGVAAGVAGGLIGLGTVTGATAGLMRIWGAARTYQLRKAELYRSPAEASSFDITDAESLDSLHLKQRAYFEKDARRQIERGDKIKRKAVLWSLGTVAAGAAIGTAAHLAADGTFDHLLGGGLQHWIEQAQNHPGTPASSYDGTGTGAGPNSGTGMGVAPDGRAPWPQPTDTLPPTGGKAPGESIADYIREHTAASKIDNGEGWDQTMKELDIKSGNWHEVLQKAGPKLHEIRYGGVRAAYWDGEHHEWRINMTGNHKMSPEALKVLITEADKENALKHSLEAATNHGGTGPETGAETGGVKLWHGAAPEQVLQKEYPGLTSRQAFFDINELYKELGPKNVFEQVTLSEHGSNNIWIDQASGSTKLTQEAQNLWDQMHPEEKTLTQLIAEGRGSNVNIVTNGERWTNVIDKLKQVGITDIAKDKYHAVLRQLWPQIKGLEYTDGTPVASLNRHGELIMNESPTKVLHPEALRRLARLLYKNHYDLVS